MLKQLNKLVPVLIIAGCGLAAADTPVQNGSKDEAAVQDNKQDDAKKKQAEQKKKDEPRVMGEVTVVVTADKEVLEQVHTRVSADTIEMINARNVSDALTFLPGLSFSVSATRGDLLIYVRGNDSRRVPVFLDGIPSYTPYRGEVDFQHFSIFDIEEIQVAKGFSSVLYGPNTLGGAINLVTKRPSEKFEGNFLLGASDGDGRTAAVNAGSNQDNFYIQVGGSMRERGDFKMSSNYVATDREDGKRRENSDYKDSKLSAKFGFTPNSNNEYVIGYMLQKGERGVPEPTGGAVRPARDFWRWPTWDKDSIYFISHTGIGSDSYIKFRAFHDTHKNTLNIYTSNTYTDLRTGSPSTYDDFTNGALLELGTTMFKGHSIRAVAQVKRDVNRRLDSNWTEWRHLKNELTSIGIEDSIKVNEKLDLTLGLGMDRQKPLDLGENEPKASQSFVQGIFGAFWKATDNLHAYVTVARKNRFPTLSDRYSERFGAYIPNPDLDPEDSTNYDIGVKAKLTPWLAIEGALFYSDINNLIAEVTNVQGNLSQMQNIEKARHSGIELSFYLKPTTWLEANAFYTYINRENVSKPESPLRETPKNRLTGFAKATPFDQWYIMASVEYQSATEDSAEVLGGYTTANLTIGYKPTKAITIDGGFTNILDRNYQQRLYFPAQGRTWFVNAKYKF
ncbi:MAG: TonB-dependent receptor [Holophagales bacterium]|jgi:iron complex outermembrane receptor protein|nr:TonB-dependent receptor [Holophagales bacterium]